MEAMDNLLNRRSVRKYQDKQVTDELLDQVLEAGLFAPTGMNRQNVVMVAVRDKETRDQLMRMNALCDRGARRSGELSCCGKRQSGAGQSDECCPRCGSGKLLDSPCKADV